MFEDGDQIPSFVDDGIHEMKTVLIKLNSIKCQANLKFPCVIWACIKIHNKKIAECANKIKIQDKVADFNEQLQFEINIPVNTQTGQFCKREVFLTILLESERKRGDQKMVGRIPIDIAQICNRKAFSAPVGHALQFCSVQGATYTFTFNLTKVNPFQTSSIEKPRRQQEKIQNTPKKQQKIKQKEYEKVSAKKPFDIETIEENPHSESESVFSKQSPNFNSNSEPFVNDGIEKKDQELKVQQQSLNSLLQNRRKEIPQPQQQIQHKVEENFVPSSKIEEGKQKSMPSTFSPETGVKNAQMNRNPQLMQKLRTGILMIILVAILFSWYLYMREKKK